MHVIEFWTGSSREVLGYDETARKACKHAKAFTVRCGYPTRVMHEMGGMEVERFDGYRKDGTVWHYPV